jgi:hypothetical protein
MLFGKPSRPKVCVELRPAQEFCGSNDLEAWDYLADLERATDPDSVK